jgi:hypothetical protein
MTIDGYVSKTVQDDVQLAGPRSRLILEAWQARMARRDGVVRAASVRLRSGCCPPSARQARQGTS